MQTQTAQPQTTYDPATLNLPGISPATKQALTDLVSNGYKPSVYAGDNLKKIKEAENNAAVMGQFVMWRHFLTARGSDDLYRESYPFMSFVVQ